MHVKACMVQVALEERNIKSYDEYVESNIDVMFYLWEPRHEIQQELNRN